MKQDKWLQLFGEGGDAAPTTGTEGMAAPSADVAPDTGIQAGMTMDDGTQVDARLAERMNAQERKHPGLYKKQNATADVQPAAAEEPARSIDDEWAEAKKGKFAEQYGRDVQAAIQQRFKNQEDANAKFASVQPMLDALIKKNGLTEGDYGALSSMILDDDSLYEDEAEQHGMTVEAYKNFKSLEAEAATYRRQKEEQEQIATFQSHLAELNRQAEILKQTFPDFDLHAELNDPNFRRMTAPNSGMTVEQAYMACHYKELLPGAVQAGVNRARTQMSQSLAANAARPVEGATNGGAAVTINSDPRNMTREQRRQLLERARMGEKVVF